MDRTLVSGKVVVMSRKPGRRFKTLTPIPATAGTNGGRGGILGSTDSGIGSRVGDGRVLKGKGYAAPGLTPSSAGVEMVLGEGKEGSDDTGEASMIAAGGDRIRLTSLSSTGRGQQVQLVQ
jgi:hypothetical protein